jgi:multisubunit Na+/H+ antiporter MnhB subunit
VALARRIAVALAALLGLGLAVFGAWFAFILGPKGTAAFHATSNAPLVLGPNVLNRVTAPVTVTASAASGPVFLGAAVPQDTDELVGQAKHNFVASADFPARTLTIEQLGSSDLADPSDAHVWRSTGEGSITVTQDQAPESVLVYPTQGGSFDVDVTVARNTWFLQALVALVVGLIVMAFAGGWLWQNLRTTPEDESGDDGTPAAPPTPQPEPTEAHERAEERR